MHAERSLPRLDETTRTGVNNATHDMRCDGCSAVIPAGALFGWEAGVLALSETTLRFCGTCVPLNRKT